MPTPSKENIEKLYKKLRHLVQYKEKSDSELYKIAAEKLSVENDKEDEGESEEVGDEVADVENMFIDREEKKEARSLLKKYLNHYSFEHISEKNTVKQLVFLEVFHNRLQRELNTYHKEAQPAPPKTVESLHANLNQISALKNQLGIRKDKEKHSQSDAYIALETLKKKFKKWREENQGSRTLSCPHCGKLIMLRIRTDIWEAQRHPFFVDRFLANKHLMTLLKEAKISKLDVARVLDVSVDYVDWLLDKIFPKSFRKEEKPKALTEEPIIIKTEIVEEKINGEQQPNQPDAS